MKLIKDPDSIREICISECHKGLSVGFVPTMGALHSGHLSLVERSQKENKITGVSIFVNPTQFDNKEDLKKYPNTLKKDIELLKTLNCDFIFIPDVNEVYGNYVISEHFDFGGVEKSLRNQRHTTYQ